MNFADKGYRGYYFRSNDKMNTYNSFATERTEKGLIYTSLPRLKNNAAKSLVKLTTDYGEPFKALITRISSDGSETKSLVGSVNYGRVSWSRY